MVMTPTHQMVLVKNLHSLEKLVDNKYNLLIHAIVIYALSLHQNVCSFPSH